MKPKEKAEELYNKYFKFCNELSHDKNKTLAKLMALACVDEITNFGNTLNIREPMMYWHKVKEEIEKI